MTSVTVQEPTHVDEPERVEGYAAVLSQVASEQRPVIVRRDGEDLAAVIPLEYLELMRDLAARQEAERLAGELDWDRLVKQSPPAPQWFEGDEPKPF